MQKIKILALVCIMTTALNAKDPYKAMQFTRFFDETFFAFKINPLKEIPCKLHELEVISLRDKPDCLKKKKDIKKYEKEHKAAIERVLKPGQFYYVTLKSKTNEFYICDVSDTKQNFRLKLVQAGFAIPHSDNETLNEAHKKAKEKKLGMYSAQFENITKCILEGIPVPGQDKEDDE